MNVSTQLVIAGTGHRPNKIGAQEQQVRATIRERLIKYQPTAVISGMALGFDQWLAEEATLLNLPVVAAVPFFGQEANWNRPQQVAYHRLLMLCTHVEVLQKRRPLNFTQAANWLQERNEWMVDHAHLIFACYNGDPSGGTVNCLRYARVRRKRIDRFDPYTLEATMEEPRG